MQALRNLAGRIKVLRGFDVVGCVSHPKEAVDFVKELKITYPIALDPEAQVGSLYGAWGLPATYLIGPNGEGLARGWGPAEWYGNGARKLIKDLTDGKR